MTPPHMSSAAQSQIINRMYSGSHSCGSSQEYYINPIFAKCITSFWILFLAGVFITLIVKHGTRVKRKARFKQ